MRVLPVKTGHAVGERSHVAPFVTGREFFAFRPLGRVRRNARQVSDISHGIRDTTFVLQMHTDRTRMDEWETHIPQREYNLDRGYVGSVSLDYIDP